MFVLVQLDIISLVKLHLGVDLVLDLLMLTWESQCLY